ncbi:MAG: helix-turn-helix domain-containing protein [Candidatus Binataceae bacterium]
MTVRKIRQTAKSRISTFGELIRQRRRLLNLTQEDLARRIGVSMPFVGHLETGHRRPSEKTVAKLAKVLGLDQRQLFFVANPQTRQFLKPPDNGPKQSAWDQFKQNQHLRRAHKISLSEMSVLQRISLLGDTESPEDFIFILNTVRRVLKP